MSKNIIAISAEGKEFLYVRTSAIKCRSEKQAIALCNFLNSHNDSATDGFRCKAGEKWYPHEDIEPFYKVKTLKGKISVTTI